MFPALAVEGSNIYVVWQGSSSGNDEIYFKKSGDKGVNWLADKQLSVNAGSSMSPAIAVDGSNIRVVWMDDTNREEYKCDIYFSRSNDKGLNWAATQRIVKNDGFSFSPVLAMGGSNIYVVWSDSTLGNSEIFLKKGVLETIRFQGP